MVGGAAGKEVMRWRRDFALKTSTWRSFLVRRIEDPRHLYSPLASSARGKEQGAATAALIMMRSKMTEIPTGDLCFTPIPSWLLNS